MSTLTPDYSYLSAFADCERKFKHAYVDGLRRREDNRIPLLAGSEIHRLFNLLYTTGEVGEVEWDDALVEGDEKYGYMTRDHLETAWRRFALAAPAFELVEHPSGKGWAEEPQIVTLRNGEPYGGVLDLLVRHDGRLVVVDLKCTTWNVSSWWANQYGALSHQMRGYCRIAEQVLGEPVEEAWIIGIHIGTRNDTWSLFQHFPLWSEPLLDETEEWVKAVRTRISEAHKADCWVQNTRACYMRQADPKTGEVSAACEFYALCAAAPGAERDGVRRAFYQIDRPAGVLASGAR
jgi:hypothetical protein